MSEQNVPDTSHNVHPNITPVVPEELTDEELSGVSGGASAGQWVNVNGALYQTSFAEYYSGTIKGCYKIERALPGRPAPYLLYPWVGWVKEDAIVKDGGASSGAAPTTPTA